MDFRCFSQGFRNDVRPFRHLLCSGPRHNALLDEVFRQCTLFKPQPRQIKDQIEHLIEREFLKRDEKNRNAYIYLP